MKTVVMKIGGSLLGLPDLRARLERLPPLFGDARPLIVAGGGEAADIVRRWDRRHGLDRSQTHRLAIRSMRLNEALLAELIPDSRLVADRSAAAAAWQARRIPVLCAEEFLRADEPRSEIPLPHSWDVTSDSIAAWVTIHWPADRLVLVKATALPTEPHDAPPEVDPYFQELTPRIPHVDWVNLRETEPSVQEWQP